ncbi:MAG: cyanophycinase [Bdellovibrionia bacterium]
MNRFLLSALLITSSAFAQERLVVVGGGNIPREAASQFAEWAQGQQAKVLIIPWATKKTQEYSGNIKKAVEPFTKSDAFTIAPTAPLSAEDKAKFLKELEQATGVFFTGGDQARIAKVLEDEEIKSALDKKYRSGTPFGGTSAGTAIMSKVALMEEKKLPLGPLDLENGSPDVTTGPGLCFLPSNVIVDQHFIIRNREARLRIMMLNNPGSIGVGIDEDEALIVENGIGKAVGPSAVVVLTPDDKTLLKKGEKYDLTNRKRVK